MTHQSRLTVKGQVTVPKDIRDSLGLKPGEKVEFTQNAAGETVIRRVCEPELTPEERMARIRAGILAIAGKYRTGQSTDDYMREIRGPYEP